MTFFDGFTINAALLTGFLGVTILLVAFGLNIAGRISQNSPSYLWMNIAGAMLAAWYAWDGRLIPFVLLELVWATAAAVRLVSPKKEKPRQ